jgi:hypothetical protein
MGVVRGMVLGFSLAVAAVGVAGCGSNSEGGGGIGHGCSSSSDCKSGLFCYTGDATEIDGLCTMDCTVEGMTDSCAEKYSNTACLVAGVCGAECGNGLNCPSGSTCESDTGTCIHS